MNTSLSSDQIVSYREKGFIHIPEFLNSGEVEDLKEAVLEAVKTMGKRKVAGEGADLQDGERSYYDRVFTQRVNLWRISDTIKFFMLHPDLGRMAATLADVDGIRVWHDQTLIKQPFANPTAYHVDNPFWSFFSKAAITIWIALEDATLENGCLWFIPGSHTMATFELTDINENIAGLYDVYPEMAKIDPEPVPMRAGDCSFHNGLTAHGAGANMTRRTRFAMTCAYMPAGSVYNGNQNILSNDYCESLKVGDVLDNEEQNPLIFSRESA